MQVELESLRRETTRLTTTLDSYKSLVDRLAARLPDTSSPNDEEVLEINAAHTRDAVEREVEGVLQTLSDRTAAMEMLNSSIAGLGFPGSDSAEMLTALASAFRAARLELEYLTPGEITLPLTSHGAEVLDLLLERLRELARKVKEGDDAVDEYHAIELNLRQQLDARVSAMDSLQADLAKAQTAAGGKDGKIRELEVANDRLRGAVDGYIRDIAELERLVESIEADAGTKDAAMTDLEARLTAAEQRAADLKDELEVAQASRKKHVASVNRRSGEALALRDARVAELRGEIDRVNGALRDAYETIRGLRVEGGRAEEQNRELVGVVEGMKGELQRVLRMSEGVMAGVGSAEEGDGGDVGHEADVDVAAKPRKLFSGKLARRISGMSKRDSGLGLLDEDEIDV
jgi:chromosome segregation ATPase